jgi:hypothetical protein
MQKHMTNMQENMTIVENMHNMWKMYRCSGIWTRYARYMQKKCEICMEYNKKCNKYAENMYASKRLDKNAINIAINIGEPRLSHTWLRQCQLAAPGDDSSGPGVTGQPSPLLAEVTWSGSARHHDLEEAVCHD